MRLAAVLGILAAGTAAEATDQVDAATPSPRLVRYRIEARLDEKAHEVSGTETVVWRNGTRGAVSELPFHLHMNAFENGRTTWLREARVAGRPRRTGRFGKTRVTALACGGVDLLARTRRDETLLFVPLAPAVPAGGEVTCTLRFVTVLPEVIARTGYAGDFHLVAQWFPKPGVLAPDGRFLGHVGHLTAEYFADYGTFDVTLDVPERFVVGATGVEVERQTERGRARARFTAEDVHDFAWVAAPGLAKRDRRVGRVRVRTLYPPAYARMAQRQMKAVTAALPVFERAYGPYPYPQLTLVVPPRAAAATGGMEYPTFITGVATRWAPRRVRMPEVVAVHELAHQWFYGLLASNEPESAWLDEGLSTYVTGLVLDRWYGADRSWVGLGPVRIGQMALSRLGALQAPVEEPLDTRAWEFATAASYAQTVYLKTDLALRTLRGLVGERAMARALRTYALRRRFTHPTSETFLSDLSGVLGREPVDAALRPVVFGNARVDYAVAEVSRRAVLVTRRGELQLPVGVRVELEDGTVRRERWDGRGAHVRFAYAKGPAVRTATVDPQRAVALDDDFRNNTRTVAPSGARRLLAGLAYGVATLLQAVGP